MITLEDKRFGKFLLKKTHTRGVKLSFAKNGFLEVRMSKPSKSKALLYVIKNYSWLEKHYQKPVIITDGFLVGEYKVVYNTKEEKTFSYKIDQKNKIIAVNYVQDADIDNPINQLALYNACSRLLKKQFEFNLLKKANDLSNSINIHPDSFRIKTMSSRWGSCNSKKNINVSCYAIYLPENLFRYLILHEIAHLKHMNHSSEFWGHLQSLDKNALENRKMLAKLRPRLMQG